MTQNSMLLEGLRVVDFGRFIAGPMCAAMLGDLGADVIRVERVDGGDDRFQYITGPKGDNGAAFLQWNRNKRSLTLDPGLPGAREVLTRLIRTADVVVANLPQSGMKQIGIDYESLKGLKSDVILVHATAFGTTGPYAERVGLDKVGQAMSGMNYLTGFGECPTQSFASWVDCTTGLFSAFGALAAIMHKRQTGEGQVVNADLLRSALNVASFTLIEEALTRRNRVATGNRHQASGPADILKTRDGWILLQCVGDSLFKRWARLVGEETWISDPRFQTDELRAENGRILSERSQQWVKDLTSDQALTLLAAARIPAAPVLRPQEVLNDPHVLAGNYLKRLSYLGLLQPMDLIMPGIEMSASPATIRNPPPTVGEHTQEILEELGFSDVEISVLRSQRVV
jgi:crotonobetainyl-CoA:carnitine CoA-transferase CaiB-like acyl-CoA transferase